jgi:hypothetical protein
MLTRVYTHVTSIRMSRLYACHVYTHDTAIRMSRLYACHVYTHVTSLNQQRKCAEYRPHFLNVQYHRGDEPSMDENGIGVIWD